MLRTESHGGLAGGVFFDLAEKRLCVGVVVIGRRNSGLGECHVERVEAMVVGLHQRVELL